jgi:hypothetical protein
LHATVWDIDGQGEWSVRPENSRSSTQANYIAYRHSSLPSENRPFDTDDMPLPNNLLPEATVKSLKTNVAGGAVLYNFRIAVSTTSDYTAKFGGTVAGGLSGVVRAINQINEIFENDLGVHFTLVADNDKLIRTRPQEDPTGSPYTANRAFLNDKLGEDGYDLGIMFRTAFGGSAGSIGNTCITDVDRDSNHKAAGYSGHPDPASDPLFVSIAAHELGHKFGAWHSFNGCYKSIPNSAFEPGSGSTIMSYAGTGCGGDKQQLQERMDRYFHAGSLDQIDSWLQSRGGRCAAKRLNPNPSPWIDLSSLGAEDSPPIPARTPFALDVRAEPADPTATLTYTWEQMDVGPGQKEDEGLSDDGIGPIFRSYPPSVHSQRTFPSLPALLGEVPLGLGEVFPATTRNLNFRLTVRDNYGSMATTAGANTRVHVVDTGEAFAVIAPRGQVTWRVGTERQVRWKVAGTDRAPIQCPEVSIDLSIDGGHNYLAQPLASHVTNTGNATVIVPALSNQTSRARLRVRCDNNIFFALSPGDFVIRN